MKKRFRIYPNGSRGGIYYLKDARTGKRESLQTTDADRALELLTARNEATGGPAHNLQKARIYMAAADPTVAMRTWSDALGAVILSNELNPA